MKVKNNTKVNGISIGSTSILMVFTVLCLTIFAVLALVTASSERELVLREKQTVTEYYAADTRATLIYNQIYNAVRYGEDIQTEASDADSVKLSVDGGGNEIVDYSVKIDEKQQLCVSVEVSDNDITIKKWRVETISADNSGINGEFWDGSSPII